MMDGASKRGPSVKYKDLRGYLNLLEEAGLLKRISTEVDLKHEVGAICALSLDEEGPALLFENAKGYKGMPLVANILSTTKQLAIAFGTPPDDLQIYEVIQRGKSNPIPPRVVENAPCQEEIHTDDDVNVYEFPTPWWHELDGGQYIGTTAGVITADPETGYINMGMYRAMIKDKNTLAINAHKDGHTHVRKNEALGRPTSIAIAIGLDPLLTYVSAQGVPSDRVEHAEYAVAGAWRGAPAELVRCRTNDLLVPAWAEIILEGEVPVNGRSAEGPHGESQGFYKSSEKALLMKANCITHRKNPISYGLICRPHEDYPKFLLSAGLGSRLVGTEGLISGVYVPDVGGGGQGLMAIVAAKVTSPEDVEKVIGAVHNVPTESYISRKPRWLIIVDDDCDIRDWEEVMWRVAMSVMPDKDIRIGPRTDLAAHEPFEYIYDSKASSVAIDATFKSKQGFVQGLGAFLPNRVNKVSEELRDRVKSRWKEYGLG